MRRLLAAAALGLLAAATLAPVASADASHDLRWVGRDGQPPLEDADVVYGSDFLDLDVRPNGDEVLWWRIEMIHEPSGAMSFCDGGNMGKRNMTLRCNWDTAHTGEMSDVQPGKQLAGHPPAANGTYLIKGVVRINDCGLLDLGCKEETHSAPEFRVTVSNDLMKPATPVARSENGTIFVEWHRNPEPDAVTVLQERVSGGAWADKTNDTHFQRAGDPGVYEYRVVANRPHSSQVVSDVTPAFEIMAPPPGAPPSDPGTVAPAPAGESPSPPPTTARTTGTTARPKSGTATRPRSTEQARGLGGSNLFSRPTVNSVRQPPSTTVTTVDDGFQEAITYPTQPPKVVEMPGEERAVERLITEQRPVDVRGVLVPLAGGLAVFVFAMQMIFMARRRPSFATAHEDDWA